MYNDKNTVNESVFISVALVSVTFFIPWSYIFRWRFLCVSGCSHHNTIALFVLVYSVCCVVWWYCTITRTYMY